MKQMTSNVEIPEDKLYHADMQMYSDLTGGGMVLDFVDPRSADTIVMIYLSNKDMLSIIKKAGEMANEKLIEMERKKKEKEDALANNIMLIGHAGCGQNAVVFENEEEMNEDGNVSNEESDD